MSDHKKKIIKVNMESEMGNMTDQDIKRLKKKKSMLESAMESSREDSKRFEKLFKKMRKDNEQK